MITRKQNSTVILYMALVWGFYFITSPLYLFESGLPQISDLALAAGMMPILVISFLSHNKIKTIYLAGFFFITITFVVNMVNFWFLRDSLFLKGSFYYLYNFFVFVFIAHMFRANTPKFRDLTILFLYAATALQLFYILAFDSNHPWRETGSFNNPNQLAYWSLLCVIMLGFLRAPNRLKVWDLLAIAALGYFQMLALSKAGILTFVMTIGIFTLSPLFSNRMKLGLIIAALAGFIVLGFVVLKSGDMSHLLAQVSELERTVDRIANIGEEADDSAEGRGYDRLTDHPGYLITGAGEGGYFRFDGPMRGAEIHSGLASLFFCYGILGLISFLAFLYQVFRKQPVYLALLVIPIMLNGLVHQNIRFTHFWVVLGLAYAMREFRHEQRRDHDPQGVDHDL